MYILIFMSKSAICGYRILETEFSIILFIYFNYVNDILIFSLSTFILFTFPIFPDICTFNIIILYYIVKII